MTYLLSYVLVLSMNIFKQILKFDQSYFESWLIYAILMYIMLNRDIHYKKIV